MSKKTSKRLHKGTKKVTERLPIPYHAGQFVDDAIMSSTEALNLVYKLLKNPQGRDEHYRQLALVQHEIIQSITALKNIER